MAFRHSICMTLFKIQVLEVLKVLEFRVHILFFQNQSYQSQ